MTLERQALRGSPAKRSAPRWAFRAVWCALLLGGLTATNSPAATRSSTGRSALTGAETAFLDELSHRTFLYFQEHTNRETGLVLDRARADGSPHDEEHRRVASLAATGFGLTAWCIAAERRWVSRQEARERVSAAMRFFSERATNQHGWFYHWMDAATGERMWNSEISSIDTALLIAGVLTARQCFRGDPEIFGLATKIYERVDFKWMLNGDPLVLSHGWKPETGFLTSRWDHYCELTILYLLAIGSPTHPIPGEAWYGWKRDQTNYKGLSYVDGGPLFVHQYSQAWVDYRGLRERRPPHADYFANSITATIAHRRFCIDLAPEFPGYSRDIWGITASDSAKGYVVWGGPPRSPAIDGTVVPCASAGSLMFTPKLSLSALMAMEQKFGNRVYGKFGFVDAFNPNTGWIDPDVIGIDLGITLLSAANLRTESVWRWFMRNVEIRRALKLAGFVKYKADYAPIRDEGRAMGKDGQSVDSGTPAKYKAARTNGAQIAVQGFAVGTPSPDLFVVAIRYPALRVYARGDRDREAPPTSTRYVAA